ncbi:MAG TPA: VOC family protein [Longimicrobiaceae bacterium]|nr:VOC family protein [Longimicrobiaceae bacterium]
MSTPAASGVRLGGIGQIAVNVHDLERALAFYRDTLGMRFLFQIPNAAFLDCGGVRLMLGTPEKPEFDHPASILYYRVDDIRAAYGALAALGVRFEDEPHLIARMPDHELWMAFFRDSEDNLLALMSEVPHAQHPTLPQDRAVSGGG